MKDNYILDILGALQQSKSKKQINSDIRQLEKTINMLRITGTFANGNTKKELNAYIKSLQSQLNHIKLTAKIDERNLKRQFDSALNGIKFKDIDALNIDENKTKLKMRKVIADVKAYAEKSTISVNIESKKNKLSNDMISYLNRNTKINESSVLLKEAEKVRELIDAVGDRKTLREATDAFQLYKSQVSATGFATQSTTDKIKTMLGHVTKIGSAFGIASMAMNNFVKSLQTLKSNDSILTEISKTSEMTRQQLKELGDEAFKTASKYGQLSSNYLLAVQEMARSGYENTSKELGKLSLLAQSAGDMTADSANNYLLATDAAYKYSGSVEKLNAALDGANYISNKNSASLTDIADATRVSASFAANAEVAIDELTAAEATMIAVTKRSGSEIGRAFRSIILNLQGVSGEFDGEIIDEEQLKKVEARCHSLGVELEYMKDGMATLRNPMDVLKDLADVYNSLPDNSAEKQGLISDLGGKFHANSLSALLSRWDMYEKMLGEFSRGTGSALEEAEKTANSWEGRLNSLQNTWDSFINTLTNKDAIMGGITFFDRLLQGAEALTDTIGEIPVILTTLNTAMVALKKNYGITNIRNEETGKLDIQGNLFGIDFTAIKQQKKYFEEAEASIAKWNGRLAVGKIDINDFNDTLVQNNAQFKDYLSTCKGAPASLKGYKAYLNQMGVSTDALRLKTIALNAGLSLGLGIVAQVAMKGFQLIGTAIDDYLHQFERQQEKLDNALSAYENVKSELDSINSELDENKKKISELEAKPKLTYAEKGQLEELKQITEQLELQKEITEWQAGNKQKDAAMESVAYVNMKYNLGDSNVKDVDGLIPNILSDDHRSLDISEDIDVTDAEYLAAAYKSASNELSGLIDKRKELSNDSQDAVFVDNDIETYKSSVEDVKTEINDMLSSLMEQKANIQDYYDTIKDTPYEDMSTDARNCYDAVQQIDAAIQTLYYGLGNNRLNSEVIDGIFNTEGIEKTKEQLVEMAQAGTLSPSVIASHEKLADAILNSNLIADEECGLFETLCNEIYALADAEKEAADSAKKMSESFSKSAMIDSLNALSDGFDIIDKIYSDVKDKDVFDFANLDTKKFQEAFGELGVEYENFIEKVSESPNDINACQQAFNELVSRYLEASGVLDNLNDENAKVTASMLELMGVSNAQELADDALLRKKAELVSETDEYISAIERYKTASDEEKQSILEEIIVGGELEQQISQITLQKILANENALNTTNDINAIYSLAQTAGFGAEALYNLAEARAFLMEAEASGDADQINEAKEAIRRIVSVEQQKLASFTADLQYTGADTTNKKSGRTSSSSEKDLWLEEYKKKLEELKRQLNEGLITQKDFYYQSEALMDEYLKNTPAHLSKYAEEIADAENTLHDEWVKTLEYEKSELEKNVSDNVLVQWQYYERLKELAEQYYNTSGASYGKFADEYDEITREIQEGQKKLWEDVFGELNTQIDDLQSACATVKDAVKEYSENQSLSIDTVQKLIDLEPQYLAMLLDENGQLQLNEESYARLAKAKLEEMKVDLAYQALNTINGLENEAQAVELLTGKYAELRDTSLGAVEAMLQVAVAEAHNRGEKQGQAADMMMQVYQNQKKVIDMADFSIPSLTGEGKDKEEKKFLKQFDWFGTLLEKISEKTSKLIDKVDKFYNWQKKNAMINRAVKSTDREISQNERAYQAYMKKANSVGLGLNYVRKIQNGALSIEDITDEKLADKIDSYQEWYDKAQSCLDTIEDLYDKQRDLIKEKLNNIISYYSDWDSYMSSIVGRFESIQTLLSDMGKRSSLSDLLNKFAALNDMVKSTEQNKNIAGITITEGSLGDSKKVADAVNRDRQELADSIQDGIDNLNVKESGTYTKVLDNIAKTKAQIDEYKDKGWDKSKAKAYKKLEKRLQDYYDLQKALDENATSDTIANYEKTYIAYQKLQNKIDRGQQLSKSEQKRFDTYTKQLEDLRAQGKSALDKLYGELAEADGTAPKQSESDRIKDEIAEIQSDLENTATYQNLLKSIETVQNKITELDEKGYENLTSGQKKTYDKLRIQLEDYYDQKQALDENATASNIAEYNKIYLAWRKLQDKIDGGKNLSENQWKQYNDYTKQLENFADEKADTISKLNDALGEALNPSDKLGQIEKTYEESAEGIYDSYQNQIDGIKGEAENAKQYQNILAKAQKLEQKKDTKGLTKSEQANLDKYNAELEAMQKGATGANISDYIKTWESWYKLQQKLDKGQKLSDSEAKNYDTYKAKLEAWNNEKKTRINDLLSQMEDDLEQLQKTYTENVSEAESEVNDYYANLYSLAKQIAEYNISTLQAQLDYLDAYISYYKELVSLYDSFSGDKLTKLLTDLGENTLADKAEAYEGYLKTLQDKYNTTMSEMNEYSQLLDALDTNDFQSSMELFDKALESYRASGDTAMAEKLQSVLDLLNERAVDADNWGEFADQWAEEWEKEFAAAKQELIGTATEIQEVNDALRQIRFDNITDAINELDTAKGILSSIADLINDEWLYDNGELSEYGRAKVALLVSQLEDSQKKASAYLDLMNEIQNSKDTYASDKAYMDDLNNATQNYYNTLGETASLENSIVEIMKRGAQEEIDSLKKIIDARKKALQTKKEYYDYDKSLKNSQKEIDSIKAQIAALEGLSDATDAATKAKLAQLKADLAEKEDALQETKDEHTYNLQIDALDEFVASLEDTLNGSTQTVAEIMEEYQKAINDAADIYRTSTDSVNDTLDKLIAFYNGMGTSIDGLDLTPDGTDVADRNAVTVNTSVTGNNKVADAVNMTTDAINRAADATENLSEFMHEKFNGGIDVVDSQNTEILGQINDNTSKTAELLEKYGIVPVSPDKLWENFKLNPIDITAMQYETMVNTKPYIPEYVTNRNEQQVINIHYDNMINVEGSVDKNVVNDFKETADDLYKNFTDRLYNETKMYTGRRPVRRSVL